MLRLLRIKINGYKMLDDDFSISLYNINRVSENELDGEMFNIDASLFAPKTIAFVGANASGKSSVLSLILSTLSFLKTGRWGVGEFAFKENKMKLSVMFYLDSFLYEYTATFFKSSSDPFSQDTYSGIDKENLYRARYDKNKGKANMISFDSSKEDVSDSYLNKTFSDTSSLVELTREHVFYDHFNTNVAQTFERSIVRGSFFALLKSVEPELTVKVLRLLDSSIEYVEFDGDDLITLKRFNEPKRVIDKHTLMSILSSGTIRGFELYIRAISALGAGRTIIVDEIENSFQKNIVFNLLFLFNNKKTNPKNAQLIFSTHYTEVLDVLSRRDSIFVTSKNDNLISVKNLTEFHIRADKVKSRDFDNNAFGTFTTYEEMMELKRSIADA